MPVPFIHPIGKDLPFILRVFRQEEIPFPLTGLPLTLCLSSGMEKVQVTDYSVSGNAISFTFYGEDQLRLGVYDIILVINTEVDGQEPIDVRGAFRLVPVRRLPTPLNGETYEISTAELDLTIWSPYPESVIPDSIARTAWVLTNFYTKGEIDEEIDEKCYDKQTIDAALAGKANKNGDTSENFSARDLSADSLHIRSASVGDDVIIQSNAALGSDVVIDLPAQSGTLALIAELDSKVDKVPGKGLSTNDYSADEKQKVHVAYNTAATAAQRSEVYTKAQTDTLLAGKANKNGSSSENFSAKNLTAKGVITESLEITDGYSSDAQILQNPNQTEQGAQYTLPADDGTLARQEDNYTKAQADALLAGKAAKNGDLDVDFSAHDLTVEGLKITDRSTDADILLNPNQTEQRSQYTLPADGGTLATVDEIGCMPRKPSLPVSARLGEIIYNNSDNHFYGYTISGWKQLDN